MREYSAEWLEELEAVTFDHYYTLQYSTIQNQGDIIHPIVRSLKTRIDLDEERFLEEYAELDKRYRRCEHETFVETTLDELVLRALLDSGHQDAELTRKVKDSVDHGLRTRQLTWYPDAEKTLLRLKELGYRLGLICNTHWRLLPEGRRELLRFLDVLTLSYEHGYMKPHYSIFYTTTMNLAVKPEKCLHVCDDPFTDIHGAKQAGMRTAYIKRRDQEAEADITIKRLSELIKYLDI